MIDIIAVTYGHNNSLKCFINSIKSQTSNNWELFIIHDGLNLELKNELISENYLNQKNIHFIEYPERTYNYGHILRKWGIENLVKNDYVLLTNADNYYIPIMIEEVEKYTQDLIYFNLIHSHKSKANHNKDTYGFMNSKLESSWVDIGNVVIKSEIAKKVGFNSINFAADWEFINEIKKLNPSIHKIDKILFVHN